MHEVASASTVSREFWRCTLVITDGWLPASPRAKVTRCIREAEEQFSFKILKIWRLSGDIHQIHPSLSRVVLHSQALVHATWGTRGRWWGSSAYNTFSAETDHFLSEMWVYWGPELPSSRTFIAVNWPPCMWPSAKVEAFQPGPRSLRNYTEQSIRRNSWLAVGPRAERELKAV